MNQETSAINCLSCMLVPYDLMLASSYTRLTNENIEASLHNSLLIDINVRSCEFGIGTVFLHDGHKTIVC